MPQFFGLSQLRTAITAQALPTLEQLATNPNHLDNTLINRFDRDEPPPYVSSSESESEEALRHPVLARPREVVLEESRDLLGQPLNENEIENLVLTLDEIGIYTPGGRYSDEARREHDLLSRFEMSTNANSRARSILKGSKGCQRRDVIVRRNIRKRWQRLGIWNPEWGIPGRVNRQPNDNARSWKWKWQSTTGPPALDPQHPINRAVQLRTNLGYGEYVPPPPRSHLRDDSSASEAESFIISRPWFIWEVEKFEFVEREQRIPVGQRGRPQPDEDGLVKKWWKERGDWTPGWKWRHESPSPEPEDLTPLNTDDMDFTPSELDALETIGPASPQSQRAQSGSPPRRGEPADVSENAATAGPEDQLAQEGEEEAVEEQPPPNPPPRRSARIAARNAKRPELDPPVTAAQGTRTRRPRRRPAASPQPPSRSAPSATAHAPKKRGRPRKTQDGGITKPAASTSTKKGRKASGRRAAVAAAAAVDGNAAEAVAAAAGKRPRGRPRRAGKPG